MIFCQVFVSSQVEQSTVISNKHGIYDLPHELSNYDLKKSKKNQESLKTSLNDSLVPSFPPRIKILLILAKTIEKPKLNFSRWALFHMKTRVSLKYFVNYCLWKLETFCFLLILDPFKPNFFDNFGNSKVFYTVLA